MADPSPDTGDDASLRHDLGSPPGTPRWVKVLGIIALVVALLAVIAMFVGGGDHGPGRHVPSGGAGGDTRSIAHGLQQP